MCVCERVKDTYTPVLLVEVTAASADHKTHDVAVFFEVTGQMAVDSDDHPVVWADVNSSRQGRGGDSDTHGGAGSSVTENTRVMKIGCVSVELFALDTVT